MEVKRNGELGLSASGLIVINPGFGQLTVNDVDLVGALAKAMGLASNDYDGLRFSGRLSLAVEQAELLEVDDRLTEGSHETV